ncbi:MAG: right-handed parallel beta-helix repeat-containing protein, partial [Flavobacteriales bacterium]
LAHLERMISTAYLDSAMNEISSEIERVDHALGQEYPNVRVEKGVLFDNVEKLKEHLPMFKNWLKNDLPLLQPDTVNRRPNLHPTISPFIPVKVYEQGNNAYVIENNGGHQVTVFGYESKETKDTVLLPSELKIGVTHWQQDRAELQLTEKARFIYYRITESDFSGKASIFKWPVPRNHSPRVSLRAKQVGNQPQFLSIENGTYKIKKGSHVISELLYIPSNSKLVVQAGTELVFKATGGILSESPIELIGSKDKPIVIQSESLNNQGLTVLQTNTESVLKHVQFQSMNSLSFEGWVLTGGVNFYESDVVLEHCSIDNGRSEDALNIIRSNFELNSCQIKSSFSDGFDSDFSKGSVVNCRFEAIGNDAVDFSGSQVKIEDCELLNIGDKAVSVGERSTLTIKNSTIEKATIGVAAKDCSRATLSNIEISQCQYGFVAYEKKSEYGGATIETKSVTLKEVNEESDIEINSKLIKDGVTIQGTKYSKVSKY